MLTEKDFHDFTFDNPGEARDVIRRAIWERVRRLKIPKSEELVILLQELEETVWLAWQCGYTGGDIDAGRIWDPEDDQS